MGYDVEYDDEMERRGSKCPRCLMYNDATAPVCASCGVTLHPGERVTPHDALRRYPIPSSRRYDASHVSVPRSSRPRSSGSRASSPTSGHRDGVALATRPPMVVDSRPPRRRSRRLSPIVDTLPLTLAVASLIVALITFVVAAFALKVDWAKAGQLAVELDAAPGIAAIVAAGVLLLRRQARTLTLALTGALLLVLAISTLGALAWQPAIHTLQARQLEGGQQWTPALQEYTLGGERAPNAPNRARVYIEWGEADLHAHQYHDAQDHLKQGQAEDPSGTTIIAWASADLVQTYHEWLAADPQGFPYDPASTFFDTYAKSGFCAADCKQSVHSFVAQMLYTEGHDEFLGSNVCNLAVPVYQNLATNYADTPQGQQAAAALAIPIDVKLTIMNIPPGTLAASRKAYFSRALYPYVLDHVTTFSDDYQTVVDSSGNVIFHGVTPGKYNLSVLLANGGRWYWRVVDLFNPYTEIVLPLCGNEITTYNWT